MAPQLPILRAAPPSLEWLAPPWQARLAQILCWQVTNTHVEPSEPGSGGSHFSTAVWVSPTSHHCLLPPLGPQGSHRQRPGSHKKAQSLAVPKGQQELRKPPPLSWAASPWERSCWTSQSPSASASMAATAPSAGPGSLAAFMTAGRQSLPRELICFQLFLTVTGD